MPEQPLDVHFALSALRRHRRTLIGAGVLGAVMGIGPVILWPPMYASSSLVLLPPKTTDPSQAAELVKTDLRVASSGAVVVPASKQLRPPMSPEILVEHLQVSAVTPSVLEIKGLADDPRRAEEISRAVANSDVAYLADAASSLSNARRAAINGRVKELRATLEQVDQQVRETTARQQREAPGSARSSADATALAKLTAQQGNLVLQLDSLRSELEAVQPSGGGASVIQTASPAARAGLLTRYVYASAAGVLVAVLIAAATILFLTRRDRRLRYRDDIADAVGSPVIASVRTHVTGSVAGWISLLHDYTPGTVDAWAWRQALRRLTLVRSSGGTGRNRTGKGKVEHPSSITVISLSGDPRGLAAGPQLATYAASVGLSTRLVPAQRHEDAAALWAACASFEQGEESRPGLCVKTDPQESEQVDLDVVLVVADRHEPKLPEIPEGSVVIMSLSAGSTTAEELARVAVTVDDSGKRIQGIVVADPDYLDRTTGRLLQHERAQQIPLPARVPGTPTPRPHHNDVSTANGMPG